MGSFKSELNRFPPNTKQATHRTKQDTCYLTSRNSNSATVTPKTTMRKTVSRTTPFWATRVRLGGMKARKAEQRRKARKKQRRKKEFAVNSQQTSKGVWNRQLAPGREKIY